MILQKSVTVSYSVDTKKYDGSTVAPIHSTLSGIVIYDISNITLTIDSANFNDSLIGVDKPITMGTISLSGINSRNYNLIIPSNNTSRIQECHTLLGHTILEIVENKMFKK
jgi:hypothetical protein